MPEITAAGKAVIIRDDGKILVIKRANDETHLQNYWDVPGGSFDYGEHPVEGLKREVREEAGIEVEVIKPIYSWTFTRDSGEQIFGTTFLCETDETEVELGDEHTDYRWVEIAELDDLSMHDELRESLNLAFNEWGENK